MAQVKRTVGQSRISSKNQVTIPVRALRGAGLRDGDTVRVEVQGPGQLRLVRTDDPVQTLAGVLTGAYEEGFLEGLRTEWD